MQSLIDQITDLAQRWRQQLAFLLLSAIVLGISLSLASTVIFYLQYRQGPNIEIDGLSGSQNPQMAAVNAKQLAALNLFGDPSLTKAPDTSNITAPETRLRLELQGVLTGSNNKQDSAIIAEKGKTGLLYNIGAQLPGNATLHAVYDDRVILKRGSSLETLNFPKTLNKNAFQAVSSSEPKASSRNKPNLSESQQRLIQDAMSRGGFSQLAEAALSQDIQQAESVAEFLSENLEAIDDDPAEFLAALGVTGADDGGYTISASALPESMLAQAGLRDGDTIRSINGLSLGDIEQDQSAIVNIVASCKARVEVQRGKRRFFVTAALC